MSEMHESEGKSEDDGELKRGKSLDAAFLALRRRCKVHARSIGDGARDHLTDADGSARLGRPRTRGNLPQIPVLGRPDAERRPYRASAHG